MSRYIEEEAVIKAIDESGKRSGITTANQCNFKEIVRKIPTADVAPKSEVAREIFGDIEKIRLEFLTEKITGADMVVKLFLLKKKYTEGE